MTTVFHANRVADLASANRAVKEACVDMIGMTRAHIADPHLVAKLERGEEHRVRTCVGAGYCIDRIYIGADALCLQNPATGRERTMPHVVEPSRGPKRTVVVVEHGTVPAAELFHALQARSGNRGRTDLDALARGAPQPLGPAGTFSLFRVGDAVASRNIHAALYDSLRICKNL